MTADSSPTGSLAAHVGGSAEDGPTDLRALPSEPFDVEPPYDASAPDLPGARFLDRELSWLHFNTRVLELAEDTTLPLLERVRFLAIFAQNLDEFLWGAWPAARGGSRPGSPYRLRRGCCLVGCSSRSGRRRRS